MAEIQFSQNSNEVYNAPYTPSGNEKAKLGKILKIAIGALMVVGLIVLVVSFSTSPSQQDKNTKAATAAARKVTPNAVVSNVKVSGGFALAIVSDPTAQGQAKAGNVTIFKVNNDGSMTQIANGSSFSPIDLLGFGIPLATQAKLIGHNLIKVEQDLAGACGYSGDNAPSYLGFNGSFNPGGWQIDAATLDGLEQALTAKISNNSSLSNTDEKIICINASRVNSNATTDTHTYISTFTLQLQFITTSGTLTAHTFTFATGPNYYRSYTLDGQKIQPR